MASTPTEGIILPIRDKNNSIKVIIDKEKTFADLKREINKVTVPKENKFVTKVSIQDQKQDIEPNDNAKIKDSLNSVFSIAKSTYLFSDVDSYVDFIKKNSNVNTLSYKQIIACMNQSCDDISASTSYLMFGLDDRTKILSKLNCSIYIPERTNAANKLNGILFYDRNNLELFWNYLALKQEVVNSLPYIKDNYFVILDKSCNQVKEEPMLSLKALIFGELKENTPNYTHVSMPNKDVMHAYRRYLLDFSNPEMAVRSHERSLSVPVRNSPRSLQPQTGGYEEYKKIKKEYLELKNS